MGQWRIIVVIFLKRDSGLCFHANEDNPGERQKLQVQEKKDNVRLDIF